MELGRRQGRPAGLAAKSIAADGIACLTRRTRSVTSFT